MTTVVAICQTMEIEVIVEEMSVRFLRKIFFDFLVELIICFCY